MTSRAVVRQVDVARAVGVSQRAVSVVLGQSDSAGVRVSEATATRIREAASRLGYFPHRAAQQLKGKRSCVIGVLVGAAEVEANYHRLSRMEGLARKLDYRFMIGHVRNRDDLASYADDFQAHMVDGVLCLRHELTAANQTAIPPQLAAMPNVIYLDPPQGLRDAWYVKLDRADGIRQAVAHVADRRRIALVFASQSDPKRHSTPIRDRVDGYREGLAALKRRVDPALIWMHPDLALTDERPGLIRRAVDELVEGRHADAIIASNDDVAAALIKELKSRGLSVPRDVAVIGYDNLSIGRVLDPMLTTVDPDHDRVATLMLDMLMARVRGEKVSPAMRRITVPPRLIVRESA